MIPTDQTSPQKRYTFPYLLWMKSLPKVLGSVANAAKNTAPYGPGDGKLLGGQLRYGISIIPQLGVMRGALTHLYATLPDRGHALCAA